MQKKILQDYTIDELKIGWFESKHKKAKTQKQNECIEYMKNNPDTLIYKVNYKFSENLTNRLTALQSPYLSIDFGDANDYIELLERANWEIYESIKAKENCTDCQHIKISFSCFLIIFF